jgi:hypothetical protein
MADQELIAKLDEVLAVLGRMNNRLGELSDGNLDVISELRTLQDVQLALSDTSFRDPKMKVRMRH